MALFASFCVTFTLVLVENRFRVVRVASREEQLRAWEAIMVRWAAMLEDHAFRAEE